MARAVCVCALSTLLTIVVDVGASSYGGSELLRNYAKDPALDLRAACSAARSGNGCAGARSVRQDIVGRVGT